MGSIHITENRFLVASVFFGFFVFSLAAFIFSMQGDARNIVFNFHTSRERTIDKRIALLCTYLNVCIVYCHHHPRHTMQKIDTVKKNTGLNIIFV